MLDSLNGLVRTDYAGNLRLNDVNKEVVLFGWVQKRRNLGSLIFIDLRDKTGISQIVFDEKGDKTLFEKAETLRSEYVIAVKGKVRERENKTTKILSGDVEVLASELRVLNDADTTPFEITDDTQVNENLRLKYRYLDLRRPSLQNAMRVRYEITKTTRNYLDGLGFT